MQISSKESYYLVMSTTDYQNRQNQTDQNDNPLKWFVGEQITPNLVEVYPQPSTKGRSDLTDLTIVRGKREKVSRFHKIPLEELEIIRKTETLELVD